MDCTRIAVLRVLDEENGEKRYNGCPGVHNELPSVRIMKHRAGERPTNDDENRHDERPWTAHYVRGRSRKRVKPFTEAGPFCFAIRFRHMSSPFNVLAFL
jgi:hypothetical protein